MTELGLNPIDLAVFALLVVAAWNGYRSGFIATLYGLASWIVAVAAGFALQGPASSVISAVTGVAAPVASALGFVGIVIAAELVLSLVGALLIRPIVNAVRNSSLDGPDRVLGAVPATLRTIVIVAIAIVALEALPLASEIKAAVEGSRTGQVVNDQVARFQPQISALTTQLGGSPLLVTKLGETDSQALDFPAGLDLQPDPVAERQLFELVNVERAQRGRTPLEWDDRLVPVARAHSAEMFRLEYFSHESPVSGSPFDRLAAARISYSRAGENLAYAQSVAIAHRALMNSEGHRENILRPEFTRMGIGVISAGAYGRMFTQLFLRP